jgi:hypothetical protein
VYQLFCAIATLNLVSDLRGDRVSIIAGIFKAPILQTAGGTDITHNRAWRLIELEKFRQIGLLIENCESKNGPLAILPGLNPLEPDWALIFKRFGQELRFEDALVQLESSSKGATHNSHVIKRYQNSVLRLCVALFDPRTTQIGPKDGFVYDLLNETVSILTNYQAIKRAVDQEYREEKIYTAPDCRRLADAAADSLLELGDLIFQDSVTGQFFCQPVTAAIAAIGLELTQFST